MEKFKVINYDLENPFYRYPHATHGTIPVHVILRQRGSFKRTLQLWTMG